MSMTDPVADMLTRIRNAVLVRQRTVDIPCSRLKENILAVLKREGYVGDYKIVGEGYRKIARVYLRYSRLGESVISEITRQSKPGRRVYADVGDLKPILRGIGIAILSTPKGILSDRECRKERVGGELLCTVW